jgi:hypothetical protein
VQGVGAAVDQVLDKLGQGGPGSPFGGQSLDLFLGRDLSGNQQPEQSFGQRLTTTLSGGESLLTLGDGHSSESDTLLGIENGSFPNHSLEREIGKSLLWTRSGKRETPTNLDSSHTTVTVGQEKTM